MNSRRRPAAVVDSVGVPIVASGLFLARGIGRQCASQRYFYSLGRPGARSQSRKTSAGGPLVTRRLAWPHRRGAAAAGRCQPGHNCKAG